MEMNHHKCTILHFYGWKTWQQVATKPALSWVARVLVLTLPSTGLQFRVHNRVSNMERPGLTSSPQGQNATGWRFLRWDPVVYLFSFSSLNIWPSISVAPVCKKNLEQARTSRWALTRGIIKIWLHTVSGAWWQRTAREVFVWEKKNQLSLPRCSSKTPRMYFLHLFACSLAWITLWTLDRRRRNRRGFKVLSASIFL